MNFAFYKDVLTHQNFRLQFSALLDNAFNHPQFFPTYGSGFVDLTSYLMDGDAQQRHYRCARSGLDRQQRRVLAWTGLTTGVTSEILIVTVSTCHEDLYRRIGGREDGEELPFLESAE